MDRVHVVYHRNKIIFWWPRHRRTLCVRVIFAGTRCLVHLSVHPSVTLVHCIQMAEDIVKLFSRPCSSMILVFLLECRYPIPRGTPSVGVQNTRGWRKLQFLTEIAHLSRKWYKIGPWLLWNVNRKSYVLYQMVKLYIEFCENLTFNDLDGPLTWYSRSRHIWSRISQNGAC